MLRVVFMVGVRIALGVARGTVVAMRVVLSGFGRCFGIGIGVGFRLRGFCVARFGCTTMRRMGIRC